MLLIIVITTPVIGTVALNEFTNDTKSQNLKVKFPTSYKSGEITILYETMDLTVSKSAFRMEYTLGQFLPTIRLVEVNSIEELSKKIGEPSWMNIYFFHD